LFYFNKDNLHLPVMAQHELYTVHYLYVSLYVVT